MSLESCCNFISQKWVFAILANAGLCIQTMLSVMMSIAIIEMDKQTESFEEVKNNNGPSAGNFSFIHKTIFNSQIDDNKSIGHHSSEYMQETIVSIFSGISASFGILSGILAERFGGKYLLGFTVLAPAVLTFTIPFAVIGNGSTVLIIARVVKELASDGLFPVVTTMIPNWTTLTERTIIGSVIYSGFILGLFFGNIMPTLIIRYFDMGWSALFYFAGVVGIIWFLLWLTLVYENPKIHPFISDEELNYLQSSLTVKKGMMKSKLPSAPWKQVFLSKEFWAFMIGYAGCHCIFYLMLKGFPKYMNNVIKFPMKNNMYFSTVPYIFMWFICLFSAWVSEKILRKQWMTRTNVRKCMSTASITVPGVFLLLASYAERNRAMVVFTFTIGMALMGSMFSSFTMNPLDFSPNYAGSMMSCGCCIALCVELLVPYFVAILTPNSTITEWRLVFWLVLLVACCSNTVYLLCFKVEVQPWNKSKCTSNKNKRSANEIGEANVLEFFV